MSRVYTIQNMIDDVNVEIAVILAKGKEEEEKGFYVDWRYLLGYPEVREMLAISIVGGKYDDGSSIRELACMVYGDMKNTRNRKVAVCFEAFTLIFHRKGEVVEHNMRLAKAVKRVEFGEALMEGITVDSDVIPIYKKYKLERD